MLIIKLFITKYQIQIHNQRLTVKSCCKDKTMSFSQSEELEDTFITHRQKQKQEAQKAIINEHENTVVPHLKIGRKSSRSVLVKLLDLVLQLFDYRVITGMQV